MYIENAIRKRTCRDCGKDILPGEKCVINTQNGPFNKLIKLNYCIDCGTKIIKNTLSELEELIKQL
jgi:RNase P subunit RPR2